MSKSLVVLFVASGIIAGTAMAVTPVVWLRAETEHPGVPSIPGAYVYTNDDAWGLNDFHSPPPPNPNRTPADPADYYRPVYSADVPRQGRVLDPITGTLYENTRSFQFDRNNTKAERLLSASMSSDAFNFGTNSFTIEFFAKTEGTNTWRQPDMRLFSDWFTVSLWGLYLEGSKWGCKGSTSNEWYGTVSLTNVTVSNRWDHHALVFDRETPGDHHVHIYVNYTLIETKSFSTNACYSGNNYFEIGNYQYYSNGSTPASYAGWHGLMDEIRIMKGALTTNQFLRMVPFHGTVFSGH